MEQFSNPNDSLNKFLDQLVLIENKFLFNSDEKRFSAKAVLGRLGFFYEKLRNTLEYKDEHLIFRSSLERILRRHSSNLGSFENPAKEILSELIIGGYLENESVPESFLEEINNLIIRYLGVQKSAPKDLNKHINSFLSQAIEEKLKKEVLAKEALVEFTHQSIFNDLDSDVQLEATRLNILLYIAIHRSLLKSDYITIRYRLLKRMLPKLEDHNWNSHSLAVELQHLNSQIDAYFKMPELSRLISFCRKVMPPYSVLGKMHSDLGEAKFREAITDPENISLRIETVYSAWRERAYDKISRTAIRSIIFIFFTKMFLAIAVELPYELWVLERVNYLALALNLLFPPLYMFVSTYGIRVPGKENLIAIKENIKKIIYQPDSLDYQIRLRKSGSLKKMIFFLVYLLTFVLSFGLLIWGLYLLEFSWVAAVLFFVFFSTVSFFAYRISNVSRELKMVSDKGGFKDVIIDFFSLPFIKLGQFLSSSFSQLNIFLFFLDFVIETPFKTILKFLDEWVSYAKEKKDDILNN